MLVPVVITRVDPGAGWATILEGNRVRGEHDTASSGERGSERLVWVAGEAEDLGLAEVALTRMLVEDNDRRKRALTVWHCEERGDGVIFRDDVDSLEEEPVFVG